MVGSRAGDGMTRGPGDAGLLPYKGAAWRIHGDFAAMMIGGGTALLMQMLHPAAAAGVWDHSNFRKDMTGRLRRTAQFVRATTFGTTAQADAIIDRVRRIHDRVAGVLPDGTPYHANDPATLTWVHVAGADAFLRAYVRYRDPWASGAMQDRYFAETAIVARRLGASDVPESRAAVARYLHDVRPQLRADDRSRAIADVLLSAPPPVAAAAPAMQLVMAAGIDLMPPWARALHGLDAPAWRRPAVRAGAQGVASLLRWSLAA
ncbi:MAG: histidine kinase [Alphaproteobacteria bacterium]|nr:MAG: histidine kinase [Alphaproteobacteria bacterium]